MTVRAAVFFHAHPDDEAIFTGGTIALLADAGVRVVVVLATTGGSGATVPDALAERRRRETEAACARLGVARLAWLGYHDSGIDPASDPRTGSFAAADRREAATRLAAIVAEEGAETLVTYDEGGIYAHRDHLVAHRVGHAAARLAGTRTVYDATVDREHLHFVETHVVGHAITSLHAAPPMGTPTVLVSTTVDVRPVVGRKRDAMAAHTSQLPPESQPLQLDADTFAAVYGHEWYVRTGPRSVLDDLDAGWA